MSAPNRPATPRHAIAVVGTVSEADDATFLGDAYGRVLGLGVTSTMLPAVTAAVMTHFGSFDTIGDTYRQLGAWVAAHATSAGAAVRERYVASVDETTGALLPHDQLRTEIIWPIVPGSADRAR
jgi:hypothetical protein